MEPAGHLSKQGRDLFEVNIDATEKNGSVGALIRFVEGQRQIQRRHDGVMAHLPKRRYQRIITQTIAAEHRAGSRRDLNDGHAF